ncbi:MAG: hypothetical protein V4458_06035 [Pseudomonadota bacterium]
MYDIIATLAAITRTPQFLAGVLFGGILSGVVWYAIGRCHGRIALAHKIETQRAAHRARVSHALMPSGSIQPVDDTSQLPAHAPRRPIYSERS